MTQHLSMEAIVGFRGLVYAYYRRHGRHDLPWRLTDDPYEILVSEIMLQQTQVSRGLVKYPEFLDAFPTLEALARAPLADVLRVWQGLGYNRRAKYLKQAAEAAGADGGRLPDSYDGLLALPGVGPATAAAVAAFAYGEARPFLETNIRAVYLHHFFPEADAVADRELLPLVEATLDRSDPRNWYYALMDYGSSLKRLMVNPSRRSRHHGRAEPFEGSRRQLRGRLLALLLAEGSGSEAELAGRSGRPAEDVSAALTDLAEEGLVMRVGGGWRVAG